MRHIIHNAHHALVLICLALELSQVLFFFNRARRRIVHRLPIIICHALRDMKKPWCGYMYTRGYLSTSGNTLCVKSYAEGTIMDAVLAVVSVCASISCALCGPKMDNVM